MSCITCSVSPSAIGYYGRCYDCFEKESTLIKSKKDFDICPTCGSDLKIECEEGEKKLYSSQTCSIECQKKYNLCKFAILNSYKQHIYNGHILMDRNGELFIGQDAVIKFKEEIPNILSIYIDGVDIRPAVRYIPTMIEVKKSDPTICAISNCSADAYIGCEGKCQECFYYIMDRGLSSRDTPFCPCCGKHVSYKRKSPACEECETYYNNISKLIFQCFHDSIISGNIFLDHIRLCIGKQAYQLRSQWQKNNKLRIEVLGSPVKKIPEPYRAKIASPVKNTYPAKTFSRIERRELITKPDSSKPSPRRRERDDTPRRRERDDTPRRRERDDAPRRSERIRSTPGDRRRKNTHS